MQKSMKTPTRLGEIWLINLFLKFENSSLGVYNLEQFGYVKPHNPILSSLPKIAFEFFKSKF